MRDVDESAGVLLITAHLLPRMQVYPGNVGAILDPNLGLGMSPREFCGIQGNLSCRNIMTPDKNICFNDAILLLPQMAGLTGEANPSIDICSGMTTTAVWQMRNGCCAE